MRLEFIACKYTVFIRHLKVLKKLFLHLLLFFFPTAGSYCITNKTNLRYTNDEFSAFV